MPPPDLGERIVTAVRREAELRDRRERRRPGRRRLLVPLASAAAAAVLTALVLRPEAAPPAPRVPVEELAVGTVAAEVRDVRAELIPHTWGVEVQVVAAGFEQGGAYRGVVRARDGRLLPAGEFLGTGDRPVACNMQAALLRSDAVGFSIVDSAGAPVVEIPLEDVAAG